MTLKDIMKYLESEYKIINHTPCEVCGGEYFAEDLEIELIDGIPYDVCECVCSKCGYEKTFEFLAPFIDDNLIKTNKSNLN